MALYWRGSRNSCFNRFDGSSTRRPVGVKNKVIILSSRESPSLKYDKYTAILKQYELEKLTYGTPKDAPTVEKPEFDISKLAKPSEPTDPSKPANPINPAKPASPESRDENKTLGKELAHAKKQGVILPKTGENTKSSVFAGLILLVASLIMNLRKTK